MKRFTAKPTVRWMLFCLLACVLAGAASARYPILGKEWGEWVNRDPVTGQAIGGGRIDCDGTLQTWGDPGRMGPMTLYRCN